jgi:hypothetical protein
MDFEIGHLDVDFEVPKVVLRIKYWKHKLQKENNERKRVYFFGILGVFAF